MKRKHSKPVKTGNNNPLLGQDKKQCLGETGHNVTPQIERLV